MVSETMTSPLDRLFLLQEVLLEVDVKTQRRGKTPDHLVHIEAAYHDARRLRDAAGAVLSQAEDRKKILDGEIQDFNEQLKKYQQQLQSVKTSREYSALLNEIDGIKREVRTREDELLALDEAVAGSSTELDRRDEEFPAEEAGYEEQMKEWRAEQAALDAEIAQANARAKSLRAELEPRLLKRFEQIRHRRAGVAVARVDMVGPQTAACSACHVRLRPQLLSDLRLSKETVFCESCKRILYWIP
jgi:predicted  nucleic acid-binding Zn-ribbon protein